MGNAKIGQPGDKTEHAKKIEHERDANLGQNHAYEIASLVLRLGVVLASVSLLSTIMAFALGSMAPGGLGLVLLAGTYLDVDVITALLH